MHVGSRKAVRMKLFAGQEQRSDVKNGRVNHTAKVQTAELNKSKISLSEVYDSHDLN